MTDDTAIFPLHPLERFPDAIVAELRSPLDPQRKKILQTGRFSATYLETWDVIAAANAIFGFGSWSYEIVHGPEIIKDNVVLAKVRLTVRTKHKDEFDNAIRMDVGTGIIQGNKPENIEIAFKGAVSDALKRAFRTFGNQFGNSLYDKDDHITPVIAATVPRPAAPVGEIIDEDDHSDEFDRAFPPRSRPKPAHMPDASDAPACPKCGSEMEFKEGVSKKTGRPYRLYRCTSTTCDGAVFV